MLINKLIRGTAKDDQFGDKVSVIPHVTLELVKMSSQGSAAFVVEIQPACTVLPPFLLS